MALSRELIKFLDNDDEPLPKRLKVANNAFKSVELPIQHREILLLKWLSNLTDGSNAELWILFLEWLKSEEVKGLHLTDVTQEDVKILSEVIKNYFKSAVLLKPEIKKLIVNSAIALTENGIFRHFFKYDLNNYFELVSYILGSIDDAELLLQVIKNQNVFHQSYLPVEKFHKYFIEIILPVLANLVYNFKSSDTIFQEVSKLLQKCLFQKNFKNFEGYFKQFFEDVETTGKHGPPKYLVKYLRNCYKSNNIGTSSVFKLLYQTFCNSYSNDISMIYKFLIILHEMSGFNVSDSFKLRKVEIIHNSNSSFQLSLEILADIFVVLSENQILLDSKIAEISFSDFLQTVILSVIRLTKKPDVNFFKIMNYAIIINPLVIESIIPEILVYVMLPENANCKEEYENLLVKIFEVFAKLNRVPNLISKMIRAFNSDLNENLQSVRETFSFDGSIENEFVTAENQVQNILPNSVLDYFTKSVITMTSRQVRKLFKTLRDHLESTVVTDPQNLNEGQKNLIYIEIISTLLCQVLSSVRMAEYTVNDLTLNNFVEGMEELKVVLEKYGAALVTMEHNLTLMRMYLNMCYTWGEVYMVLSCYSIDNEVSFHKNLDNDYSACNITYMHSYLTTEQWCLISQRITNFGEKPCKQLMQKLFTQRIKAMQFFENNVNEEIINSYNKSLTLSLHDCWEDVIQDTFIMNTVLPKMQTVHILSLAELFIKSVIDGNEDLLNKLLILDNEIFFNALVYTLMFKIKKIFKTKHKQHKIPYSCVEMYNKIDENLFLQSYKCEDEIAMIQEIVNTFQEMQTVDIKNEVPSIVNNVKLNEEKIYSYVRLVKLLPITYLKSNVQLILYLYLSSVLRDLNPHITSSQNIRELVETLLTGILQSTSVSFAPYVKFEILLQCVIRNFDNYNGAFIYLIGKMFKSEDSLKNLKSMVDYLVKNLNCCRHLKCTTVVLDTINKHKMSKYPVATKDAIFISKQVIHKALLKLIASQNENNTSQLVHQYALLLKESFCKDNGELETLLPYLNDYIETAINHFRTPGGSKDGLVLFSTVLYNRSKFSAVSDDFLFKVWNACKCLSVPEDDFEDYSKVIVTLFEHIPNEQFSTVIGDLLQYTITLLQEKDHKLLLEQIKIWHSILTCSFNADKAAFFQKALQSLLEEVLVTLYSTNEVGEFHGEIAKFEIHMLETVRLPITATSLDIIFLSVSALISKSDTRFTEIFTACISILEALLKFRTEFTLDTLPSFLQQYRALLCHLVRKSDSNLLNAADVQQISDCGHKLEKLTNQLVGHNKHMKKISAYLIADILHQYEVTTVHPSVKLHINNCIYSLMTLCDRHSIPCLMRVLTTASTEMFKFMYDNYNKYYRFTGKV